LNRYSIMLVVASIMLSSIGLAAAVDFKCVWEPCGEKVDQGEIDATYVLKPVIKAQFAFYDYNMPDGVTGEFDDSDSGYIDINGDGKVTAGIDVRITPWHNVPVGDPDFKYPANTKVGNDLDQNLPLVVPQDQAVVSYIDIKSNDVYDLEDPVYVDTDNSGDVSTNDIRLTANIWGFQPYTTVAPTDDDRGESLSLIDSGMFVDLLGFIDSDCSSSWTCVDKLYLQQLKDVEIDPNANYTVTIGDLRIYIPQEAIDEGWPECGTKVHQANIDATYTLSNVPGLRIGYYDFNNDNIFNGMDSAYVDLIDKLDTPNRVDVGDVRITAHHNVPTDDPLFKFEPNTKVGNDEDQDLPLLYPNQNDLIKYFDINGMYGYDLNDPLYVDMDQDSEVSLYDIRLTPRASAGPAYSTVAAGDGDLGDTLKGFDPLKTFTPEDLIGYIDSDCNGEWSCPDKLYLEQPEFIWVINPDQEMVKEYFVDRFVTIGDFRLYIPQWAIDQEEWPACGTKVMQCDIDAVYRLKSLGIDPVLRFYDFNGDGVFNDHDTLYVDMDNSMDISYGDIRLTAWHDFPEGDPERKYEPNTKVFNDLDLNKPLYDLPDPIVTYYDINGMYGYDLGDPVYIDVDGSGTVTTWDVRLTATAGFDPYTTVKADDLDRTSGRVLVPIDHTSGDIAELIGYIDSDCSNSWTCPDKLYLIQDWPDVVTIGDLRLYIPPGEIGPSPTPTPGDCDTYDANENGNIEINEAWAAVQDWLAEEIEISDAWAVVQCWLNSM